ncbi:MAG: hypothetical protein GY781_15145 [Gammaproteobacteria bacterium]|nr:hypothetical protein [Gammaproteobacteria bacterium]
MKNTGNRSSADRKSEQGKGDLSIGSQEAYRNGYDNIKDMGTKFKETKESERK